MSPLTLLPGFAQSGLSPASQEFWNSKPFSDWSPEEMAQLTTASPWAVKTRVKMTEPVLTARPSVDKAELPTKITNRLNKPVGSTEDPTPPEPRGSNGNSSAPMAFYGEVVVSWESAAPVRLARKDPLPPEFDDHYALRVTGLPAQTFMPETGRTPVILRLRVGTRIEVGSGKHEKPDYVLRMPEKSSILFAFPAHTFPLGPAERFVSFAMDLNQMMVRARFDLRLMNFEKAIAV